MPWSKLRSRHERQCRLKEFGPEVGKMIPEGRLHWLKTALVALIRFRSRGNFSEAPAFDFRNSAFMQGMKEILSDTRKGFTLIVDDE
jgi:hypothetical protein